MDDVWQVSYDNTNWRDLPIDLCERLSASYHRDSRIPVQSTELFHQAGRYSFDLTNMVVTDANHNGAVRQVDDVWQVSYNGTNWHELQKDLSVRLSASYHRDPRAPVQSTELFQAGKYSFDLINMVVTDVSRSGAVRRVDDVWQVSYDNTNWRDLPIDLCERLSASYHRDSRIPVQSTELFHQAGRYSFDLTNMTLTDDNNCFFLLRFTEPRVEGWWSVFCERWREIPWDLNNRLSASYRTNPAAVVEVADLFNHGKYSFDLTNMTVADDNNAVFPLTFAEVWQEGSWCVFWDDEWRALPWVLGSRLSTSSRQNPAAAVEVADLFDLPGKYSFNVVGMTVTDLTRNTTFPIRFAELRVEGSWSRILG